MLGIVVSVADVVVHRRPTTPTWTSKGKESRQDLEPNPNIDFLPPPPGQHSTHPPHLGQTKPWRRALRWLRGLNLSPPPDRYTLKQPPAGYRDKSKLFDQIQRVQWGWLRGSWGCVPTSSRRGLLGRSRGVLPPTHRCPSSQVNIHLNRLCLELGFFFLICFTWCTKKIPIERLD